MNRREKGQLSRCSTASLSTVCDHKLYLWSYKEANGIKKLCPNPQSVEKYQSFIDDLYRFYEYDI